jgi:polyisoprenoid-binding protein YceI
MSILASTLGPEEMMNTRCLLLPTVVLLGSSLVTATDTWQIDPNHTAAHFAVQHLGISTIRGEFTKISGTAQYDPADITKLVVDVTIDATSENTNLEMRDRDVRGPNLLDVQRFPTVTFKSKQVETVGQEKLKITGDLTLHGVTKTVVLDVDGPNGPINDPRGGAHMGASGTTTISRKDFSIEGYPKLVGDQVQITIDVELTKSANPAPRP